MVSLVFRNHREGEEGICFESKDLPLQHRLGLEGQDGVLRLRRKAHRDHEGHMGWPHRLLEATLLDP